MLKLFRKISSLILISTLITACATQTQSLKRTNLDQPLKSILIVLKVNEIMTEHKDLAMILPAFTQHLKVDLKTYGVNAERVIISSDNLENNSEVNQTLAITSADHSLTVILTDAQKGSAGCCVSQFSFNVIIRNSNINEEAWANEEVWGTTINASFNDTAEDLSDDLISLLRKDGLIR